VKPQIAAERLDGRDASPHLRSMPAQDDRKKPDRESREAKLAQALRANLRRRKAAGAPPPAPKSHETSAD